MRLDSGALVARGLVTRALWQEVVGADPAFGAAEAGGAVERVNLVDAAVFANMLSRRDALSPCYEVRCQSLAEAGAPRLLTISELAAVLAKGRACPQNAPWCIDVRPCEVIRTSEACGYRLPTMAEWEGLVASGEPRVEVGALAELAWPDRQRVTQDEVSPVLGASWLTSPSAPAMRSAPTRIGLRAFNVGFRLALDAEVP